MFTGIVSSARVQRIIPEEQGIKLTIQAPEIYKKCKHGDSVAIDGACLTVCGAENDMLDFYVSSETIGKTIIAQYQPGTLVNTELPLCPQDPIGGHYVLGHVDCTATVSKVDQTETSWFLTISVPEHFCRYLVYKGSVTLNGVSLTVNLIQSTTLELCIIPVTLEKTNLKNLQPGDRVNMEFDILAKYTEKLLQK
jgi:riboflavin synthase